MSKALEMRARALMVALVSGFDLTGRMDWLASIRQDYERDRQPSRRSLVVGAGVPGLADWIAQDVVSTGGEITIVDEPATTVAVAPRPGLRVVKTKLDDYAFDPRAFDQALGSVATPTFETVHGLLRTLQETARSTPLIAEATCDQVIQVWLGNRLTATAHQAALTDTLRVARKGGRLFAVVLLADEPIDVTTGAVPAVLKDHLSRSVRSACVPTRASKAPAMSKATRSSIGGPIKSSTMMTVMPIRAASGSRCAKRPMICSCRRPTPASSSACPAIARRRWPTPRCSIARRRPSEPRP